MRSLCQHRRAFVLDLGLEGEGGKESPHPPTPGTNRSPSSPVLGSGSSGIFSSLSPGPGHGDPQLPPCHLGRAGPGGLSGAGAAAGQPCSPQAPPLLLNQGVLVASSSLPWGCPPRPGPAAFPAGLPESSPTARLFLFKSFRVRRHLSFASVTVQDSASRGRHRTPDPTLNGGENVWSLFQGGGKATQLPGAWLQTQPCLPVAHEAGTGRRLRGGGGFWNRPESSRGLAGPHSCSSFPAGSACGEQLEG